MEDLFKKYQKSKQNHYLVLIFTITTFLEMVFGKTHFTTYYGIIVAYNYSERL
jgi:hypothetical protein